MKITKELIAPVPLPPTEIVIKMTPREAALLYILMGPMNGSTIEKLCNERREHASVPSNLRYIITKYEGQKFNDELYTQLGYAINK